MGRRTNDELWAAKTAPKKRGEGSVFLVRPKDGTEPFYRATRTISWDAKARRSKQITGSGQTPEEAIQRRELNYLRHLAKLGIAPEQDVPLKKGEKEHYFQDVADEWFLWKKSLDEESKGIAPSTAKQYETLIRLYIHESRLGRMPIRSITRVDVRDFFSDLKQLQRDGLVKDDFGKVMGRQQVPKLGLSNRRAIYGIVSMIFKYSMVEKEYIFANPAYGLEPPPKPKVKKDAEVLEKKKYVAKNLALFLKGRPDELRWIFAMATGCRQSEVLGLTHDCFSYVHEAQTDTPRVIIKQQLQPDFVGKQKKTWVIDDRTKSENSHRIIPLDARLVQLIREHKKQQDEWRKSEKWDPLPGKGMNNLVFTLPNGRPITHQRDNKRWRQLLQEFNLPYIPLHSLRHFAASMMIANGANINAVSAILGHGSVSITRAVYIHDDLRPMVAPMKGLLDTLFRDRDRGFIEEWDENGPLPKVQKPES